MEGVSFSFSLSLSPSPTITNFNIENDIKIEDIALNYPSV